MKYKYPVVIVEWNDAVSYGDTDGEPTHAPSKQATVGWLIKQTPTGVTIAGEYYVTVDQRREESFIPAGMITKVTKIK